jgi:hypothetical protein
MKEVNLDKTTFYAEVAAYCNSITYQGRICYDFNLVTTSAQIHALMGALIESNNDFDRGTGGFETVKDAESAYFESAWEELGL